MTAMQLSWFTICLKKAVLKHMSKWTLLSVTKKMAGFETDCGKSLSQLMLFNAEDSKTWGKDSSSGFENPAPMRVYLFDSLKVRELILECGKVRGKNPEEVVNLYNLKQTNEQNHAT